MSVKLKAQGPALHLGLAAVYFVACKLALHLAFLNPSATPVWPGTGIALTALLLFGFRVWPTIFAASFLVNFFTAGTALTSLGISFGNTMEALLGYVLVTRYASGRNAFQHSNNIFRFALFAGMLATAVSATIGCTTLVAGGLASWANYSSIWLTWWLGDGVGALVLTPFLLLWIENPHSSWSRQQLVELTALFLGLLATALIVFGDGFSLLVKDYPFEYLCFPFLMWAAFRFGRRKAATAICVLGMAATWGTVHGHGPFARNSHNTSLLLLQSFMATAAITIMVLAAESTEHMRAEEHIRRLAWSDPLTGLANYRRLVEAVDQEVKRFGRSNRPFALILFDLDQLKRINDTYGHTVGSRALCRFADVLRLHSREIDIAARYGGDEFALILPETDAESACRVAQRVSARLRNDSEEPSLSVSFGVATYPADGHSLDDLLVAADRVLYSQKATSGTRAHWPA